MTKWYALLALQVFGMILLIHNLIYVDLTHFIIMSHWALVILNVALISSTINFIRK